MTQVIKIKVDSALKLDGAQKYQDAAVEYFSCVQLIIQHLYQQYLPTPVNSPNEVKKLYGLIRHCLNRSEEILLMENRGKADHPINLASFPSVPSTPPTFNYPNPPSNPNPPSHPPPTTFIPPNNPPKSTTYNSSSFTRNPDVLAPSSQMPLPEIPKEIENDTNLLAKLKQYSAESEKELANLALAYQHKLQKIRQSVSNPILSQRELSDLNLYYIRQKTEIESILKSKQRQAISEAQSALIQPEKISEGKRKDSLSGLNPIQFLKNLGDSNRTIGRKKSGTDNYSEFKQLVAADKEWQKTFEQTPSENKTQILQNHLNVVLNHPNHPLGNRLIEFVLRWKDQSLKLDTNAGPEFDELRDQIKPYFENTEQQVYKSFPEIEVAEYQSLVTLCIEEALFKKIYGNLFELYKVKNFDADQGFTKKCIEFKEITPQRLAIPKDYWLVDEQEATPQRNPYEPVIRTLRTLSLTQTPTEKMNVLLQASRGIVDCVQKFYSSQNVEKVIGADQLLPLLTFVLIRANIPNAFSESAFLTDFISESAMIGEMGYMLASFHTCLQYISTMDENTLDSLKDEN